MNNEDKLILLIQEQSETKEYLKLVESEVALRTESLERILKARDNLILKYNSLNIKDEVRSGNADRVKTAYSFQASVRIQIRRIDDELNLAKEDLISAENRKIAVLNELKEREIQILEFNSSL
jgi:hypothetical protein